MKRLAAIVLPILIFTTLLADDTTTRMGLTVPSIGSTGYGPKINADLQIIDASAAVLGTNNDFTGTNSFAGISTFSATTLFSGPMYLPGGSYWTSSGNLGLFTLTPNYGLDISTSVNIAGNFYLPTGAGSGKIWTSDGSGLGSWNAPSLAIGSAVSGGAANRVLFEGYDQNLTTSLGLEYSTTTQSLYAANITVPGTMMITNAAYFDEYYGNYFYKAVTAPGYSATYGIAASTADFSTSISLGGGGHDDSFLTIRNGNGNDGVVGEAFNSVGGMLTVYDLGGYSSIQMRGGGSGYEQGLWMYNRAGSPQITLSTTSRSTFTSGVDVGSFKMATGAGTGKVMTSNSTGVGSWAALPAVSTGTTITGAGNNRVLYTDGSGLLATSSNFTYDGSTVTASTITATTAFYGGSLTNNGSALNLGVDGQTLLQIPTYDINKATVLVKPHTIGDMPAIGSTAYPRSGIGWGNENVNIVVNGGANWQFRPAGFSIGGMFGYQSQAQPFMFEERDATTGFYASYDSVFWDYPPELNKLEMGFTFHGTPELVVRSTGTWAPGFHAQYDVTCTTLTVTSTGTIEYVASTTLAVTTATIHSITWNPGGGLPDSVTHGSSGNLSFYFGGIETFRMGGGYYQFLATSTFDGSHPQLSIIGGSDSGVAISSTTGITAMMGGVPGPLTASSIKMGSGVSAGYIMTDVSGDGNATWEAPPASMAIGGAISGSTWTTPSNYLLFQDPDGNLGAADDYSFSSPIAIGNSGLEIGSDVIGSGIGAITTSGDVYAVNGAGFFGSQFNTPDFPDDGRVLVGSGSVTAVSFGSINGNYDTGMWFPNGGLDIGLSVQHVDCVRITTNTMTLGVPFVPYQASTTTIAASSPTALGETIQSSSTGNYNIWVATATGVAEGYARLTDRGRQLTIVIDGGGSAITTGAKKIYMRVPYDMKLTGWDIVGDVSGAIVVDLWKSTYATFPPVVGGTFAGTEKPTITASGVKGQDTSLTSMNTSLSAGDYIEANVDSCTAITKAVINLYGVLR